MISKLERQLHQHRNSLDASSKIPSLSRGKVDLTTLPSQIKSSRKVIAYSNNFLRPLSLTSHPCGIYQHFNVEKIASRTKLYDKCYSHKTTFEELAKIKSKITDSQLIIVGAAYKISPNSLILCAIDYAHFALRETFNKKLASKSRAGIFWYQCKGKSFGFSNCEEINLDLQDTIAGD